tara:strand:- start:333 stop:503 length:171 start_codon:yes stop_codon:yes gene_type:complete
VFDSNKSELADAKKENERMDRISISFIIKGLKCICYNGKRTTLFSIKKIEVKFTAF